MAKQAKLSDSPILTPSQILEFQDRLETFRAGVEVIYNKYWIEGGYTHSPGGFADIQEPPKGRYIRINILERKWTDWNNHSKGELLREYLTPRIHTFIDKLTGDILKPASWKAPARHARGNLYDPHNGLSRITEYGPEYLK